MRTSQRAATHDAIKALLALIELFDVEDAEERDFKISSIYYLIDNCGSDTLEILSSAIAASFLADYRPASVIILEALFSGSLQKQKRFSRKGPTKVNPTRSNSPPSPTKPNHRLHRRHPRPCAEDPSPRRRL
jgi:hypothetical protein